MAAAARSSLSVLDLLAVYVVRASARVFLLSGLIFTFEAVPSLPAFLSLLYRRNSSIAYSYQIEYNSLKPGRGEGRNIGVKAGGGFGRGMAGGEGGFGGGDVGLGWGRRSKVTFFWGERDRGRTFEA
ncbi:hypothetical protein ACFE04_019584 [Oxalis oulophora]